MFTDVEGSTQKWERAPEPMRRALARHDELLRDATERNNGVVFKTVGDAFCSAFNLPEEALRSAIEAQRALAVQSWPPEIGALRIRIGLHTGDAEVRDGDYFGQTLNRVARLMSVAHGAQTIVSSATATLLRPKLDANISLRDLGSHRLKDLGQPERIFQVVAEDLPTQFPPLTSLDAHPNNLPSQISAFVGREREIEELRAAIANRRLVTAAGAGGIGKTRLALQLAAETIDEFKDGSWFVQLAEIGDPLLVAQAVAAALHVRETSAESIEQTVIEHLSRKSALIVLDNAEHVLSGVATFVRRLLEASPEIRVLVTSREPIHVTGEQVFRLGGLDASAQLFFDRAKSVRPNLALGKDGMRVVQEICDRLERIPLAIELAAARAATLSIEQLAERLTSQLKLLVSKDASESERHRTLRSTIEWSYRLLNPSEQGFLARLAAFEGSFSLEACEAIACEELQRESALDLLDSLVDKSFITYTIEEDASRYRLLDAIREFAADLLRTTGEAESAARRHIAYYKELAQRSGALEERDTEAAIRQMQVESSNVRAALRRALDEQLDLEAGREIVLAMNRYWSESGGMSEGWYWVTRALEGLRPQEPLLGRLLYAAARLAHSRADFVALEKLAQQLLDIHERSGDSGDLARALNALGNAKYSLGDETAAEALYRRALENYRIAGDDHGVAVALMNLGSLAADLHLDHAAARELLTKSLEIFRDESISLNLGTVLANLGEVAFREGDQLQALSYAQQSRDIFDRLGNKSMTAWQFISTAQFHLEQREFVQSMEALRAGRLALRERANNEYIALYFEVAFLFCVDVNAYELAARILGYLERYRKENRIPRAPSAQTSFDLRHARLMKTLGAPAIDRLLREGANGEEAWLADRVEECRPWEERASRTAAT